MSAVERGQPVRDFDGVAGARPRAAAARPTRLLLIEDNPGDVLLIRECLRDARKGPLLVEDADCLAHGLETLARGATDLVLLDLSLPDSRGLETLAAVRASAPAVPIVVLTGWNDEEIAVRAVREGAQDYLVKGQFDGELLVRAIRYAIERMRAEQSLRESEQKYRVLVESAGDAIFIAQDDFVKFPNPATLAMTGYSAEELAGVPFLDLVHPDDRDKAVGRYAEGIGGTGPRAPFWFRILRKTGEELWVELTARAVAWEGRPGILCFLRDLTRERRLEAQFIQAQKMEAVGQLAGGIAHEFNNALTAIFGYAEILRMRLPDNADALQDIAHILQCAERAATLTRQLLASARRLALEPVNLDLNAMIVDLMRLVGKVVGERIETGTDLAEGLPTIRADRGHVEQVLMNLCLNARDAMPDGGRLLVETEEVRLDDEFVKAYPYIRAGRYVQLKVTDTGIGMDEATRERVFEPFFTTKGPEKGTGLGLSMVYGIVKQHDGYIHVYSEPGRGSTFKVYFPVAQSPADVAPAAGPEARVRGGTETILLAEDEDSVRWLAKQALEALGYRVLAATNGEEAVALIRQDDGVALALLDVVMPGKGGKEAYDEMRRANPRLKVIFMSGYTAGAVAGHEGFGAIGDAPFLPKPFGPVALGNKVREVLDKG